MKMRAVFILLIVSLYSFLHSVTALAGPWFTGPLLAPNGHTIPTGHINFETYGFNTLNYKFYDKNGNKVYIPHALSRFLNPILSYGLTDKFDLQLGLPFMHNSSQGASFDGIGDAAFLLNYQLLEQKNYKWRPDIKISFQQILPSSTVDGLNLLNNGTDVTGLGSYQIGLQLNLQHLLTLPQDHYLRSRLSLNYLYANPESIAGPSAFGGGSDTYGKINPGNFFSVDVAGELTLTQNWVAVMEMLVATRGAIHFFGTRGVNPFNGLVYNVGGPSMMQVGLAPALEYNFSPNIGIIAGPWFTIAGRNTADFMSYVIALNIYL